MRTGLAVAGLLLVAGLIVRTMAGGAAHPVRFTQLLSTPEPGDALLMAGALVLALTPAVQVIAVLVGWLRVHDYRYSAVAATVIGLIALSMLLGISG